MTSQGDVKALPSMPNQHQSASPSPKQSCPADEQLNYSMERLKLQLSLQRSRSRERQCDTPTLGEKPRKQVHFEVGEELGKELNLPTDLALFLAEGASTERTTKQLPAPTENPQHHHD